MFILSATAEGFFPQYVVNSLQRLYPNAAIFGGMTGRHLGIGKGSYYHPADPQSDGSVAVLALKGNVPIHCVVSRGVESLSPVYSVLPTAVSESGFRCCTINSLIDADGKSHTPIEVIGSFSTVMNSRQVRNICYSSMWVYIFMCVCMYVCTYVCMYVCMYRFKSIAWLLALPITLLVPSSRRTWI